MRALVAALAATVVLTAATLPAQAQPVFRTGVDLIRLDVRVTDGDGRPVKDLRQDEIRIVENGRVRPILFFQHVDEPSGDYMEVARRTIGSEVSTNRGAPRGHLYVFVFDQPHITPGNEARARRAAERFMRTRVRRGDRVALYGLPGPGPRLGFTADVDRAIAELGLVRGALDRETVGVLGTMTVHEAYEIARGNEPLLARVAARLARESSLSDSTATGVTGRSTLAGGSANISTPRLIYEDAQTIVRKADEVSRQFLLGVEALIGDLQPIEGRKTIVLVSEGFYPDHVSRELEQVAAAAARAYGVVFAVDVSRRADQSAASAPADGIASELQSRLEPLGSLALETDGRLFPDAGSWTDEALAQIARESQAYYLVGFAPDADAARDPTRYRRIEVAVSRPGIRVSTRTGYALEKAPPSPVDRRRAIDLALAAPYPLQEVPVEFTTYTLRGDGASRQRVVTTLEAELPVAGSGAAADVVFAVRRAADGHLAASGSDRMALPAATDEGRTSGTARYRVQFELDPGQYVMRVVVREPGGLIGSADRRFAVRALTARDVSASDLVFSAPEGGLAVRPHGYAGGVLSGVLELYGGTRAELEQVVVIVDLRRYDGATVTSLVADPMAIRETAAGPVRPIRIDLPLSGIEPGEYVARARVRVGGETAGEVSRDVEVLPRR